jgi:signal transduction histidine kinase
MIPRGGEQTESMAAVGDVAGNLVHILNNGVVPVYLACERVAKLAPTDDSSLPLKQAIGELVGDVEGFRDRVLQLKERYARAIQGNAPIDVNELAKTMAPTIVTRDDIEVLYDLDPAIGVLNLPPAIEDVLWNLLSNAKANMPRKRRGTIRIVTKLHKGAYTGQAESLELCVADTGVGIATSRHEDIFILKPGAHGYGLWWVKTFVERCDGTIELDSDEGRGAAFTLRFPLAAGSMRGLVEVEEL